MYEMIHYKVQLHCLFSVGRYRHQVLVLMRQLSNHDGTCLHLSVRDEQVAHSVYTDDHFFVATCFIYIPLQVNVVVVPRHHQFGAVDYLHLYHCLDAC